jgi:tRNA pseudouridine13 synthase
MPHPSSTELPYITPDLQGVGGEFKQRPEDFFVQEIPLYEPSGEGEHTYAEIEKIGLSTFDALHAISSALGVSSRDIGYAGMKDTFAVTRQWISIPRVDPAAVEALEIEGIKILGTERHTNKIRLGHLKANRFAVKIRDVMPEQVIAADKIMQVLVRRGLPNFFGQQRFGRRNNNDLLGAALVRGDDMGFLNLMLGDPQKDDAPKLRGARQAFERKEYDTAMRLWPRTGGMERRILHRFIRTKNPGTAVRSVDEKLRRLMVSAVQSRIFNDVLAARLDTFDLPLLGDWCMKLDNGACFEVTDVPSETARAVAWEISPTGPMLGYRLSMATGPAGDIEQAVFQKYGLTAANFKSEGRLRVKGTRRAMRVRIEDLKLESGVDNFGPHITLAFSLPAGAFATTLLREVMKSDGVETEDASEDQGTGPADPEQSENGGQQANPPTDELDDE